MQYELTLKILVDSPFDKERVARQVESLFEFGTIGESIVDGLGLWMKLHDFQASVLNQHPPVAVTEQDLFGVYLVCISGKRGPWFQSNLGNDQGESLKNYS